MNAINHSHFIYRLTALFFILGGFRGDGTGIFNVWVICLSILAILLPSLIEKPLLWWAIFLGMLGALIVRWEYLDNNKFLSAYWVLACALSTHAKNPSEALRLNAKILVGLTFTTAVLMKSLGGQYFNGFFMEYVLLTDFRLSSATHFLGGLSAQAIESNLSSFRDFHFFPGLNAYINLVTNEKVQSLALFLSYWTLILEAMIGIGFLLSRFGKIKTLHNIPLMLFVGTTYLMAYVPGFSMMLAILGWTQCSEDQKKMRGAFLGLFILTQFFRLMPYIHRFFLYQ